MLRCASLARIADHFFTDASLELRDRDDEWNAVAALAGVARDRLLLLHQVHGRAVAVADRAAPGAWMKPEADAIVGGDPTAALVVRVADCAPILLGDRRLGVVGAVHAGWRSTMQRIAAAAVDTMQTQYGTVASDLVAAIGPSLGRCCGEMGEEVLEAFRAAGHREPDIAQWFVRSPGIKPHFDLWQANRDQLLEAGIPERQIHTAGICTRTNAGSFHSYRAAGPRAGRMAAVIRARQGS